MMNRPLCSACHGNPVAINYRSGEKIRYRRVCGACVRKGKKGKQPRPAWQRSGYTKKLMCEKCGFKPRLAVQMFVYYVDGNLKNNDWTNLKTVCANCRIEINGVRTTWLESPIVPDF